MGYFKTHKNRTKRKYLQHPVCRHILHYILVLNSVSSLAISFLASLAEELPEQYRRFIPQRRIRGLTPKGPNGNFSNIALHTDSTPCVANKGINQNTPA
ncbi:hypothetical protein AVEN_115628-1 [Araneus ventricosus]|uniref:Uncharacterized protein n=1 Tax=Araneus ventricosus TaxID=182803 RepID=A0A4Y2GXR9_ARAVE|nr:hypothetical protein AVEN_115628-1 [Araneus ventricosus]